MNNEKVQIANHTYDAVSGVIFNKKFKDLTSIEKDIIKQMCE